MSPRDRHVLVIGLGISGKAMLRWCARSGAASLRGVDSRAAPPGLEALRAELPGLTVGAADAGVSLLDGVDLVCVSPGISPRDPAFGAVLDAARARGIDVAGELALFSAALRELHAARGWAPTVLAVTGTNGKTTVTSLTAHLLRGAGIDAVAAGNIGDAMLDALAARLGADALPQAWVLELSSFQLHGDRDFAARAATVLNLTQDHLDWHAGMDEYAADKARIFGPEPWNLAEPAGMMLLNRDDPLVAAMRRAGRRTETFGLGAPVADGDWGVVTDHGVAWLARARAEVSDEPPKRRPKNAPPPPPAPVSIQLLMPADALRIHGGHNRANALAALALGAAAGAPLAAMLHALRDYRGEPHRCQSLGVIDGVEWIEDSKGTNVGATAAALHGLDRPVLLIAGGDGKGQDFAPLAVAAAGRVRTALLIGRDAAAIAAALDGVCTCEICPDLETAARRAADLAVSGDVVLLSPACASLDMFRDYAHRAAVFAAAAAEIALERGQMLEGAQ